ASVQEAHSCHAQCFKKAAAHGELGNFHHEDSEDTEALIFSLVMVQPLREWADNFRTGWRSSHAVVTGLLRLSWGTQTAQIFIQEDSTPEQAQRSRLHVRVC